ncbi:hypothetical protein [Candidatus Methylacidithermus pantelleriae]|uniref:Uncharacterized protein n=1 Tax=Candidatus Methylacidithermus pantelleriae TaxID=2744239 RepID=A0A8J2FT34_9BACT|nr:hypothetical protein [Candidatus Methylacidithermus pantelleriae]CAF0701680.1 hypothetical protein MPNT_400011 [Candidatus Methylacidithermus pantelleriae]
MIRGPKEKKARIERFAREKAEACHPADKTQYAPGRSRVPSWWVYLWVRAAPSRKEFSLQENGYADHTNRNKHCQTERSSQFYVLGSKDETAGNHCCQAVVTPEAADRLPLRLPYRLGSPSQYLVLEGLRFACRYEAILQALSASRMVTAPTKRRKLVRKPKGSALELPLPPRPEGVAGVGER